MTKLLPTRRRPRSSEEGYVLLAVIFMLAIVLLTLAIAAPKVAKEIQRDRELETMQRGKQYIRAIKLYYKKFGSYPPNIDALIKTNNIRFLRKKYVDPTTGKDEWKPIRFGQNKAPTAMGFFGQPIAGSTLAGIGPNGGNGVPGASALGGSSSAFGPSSSSFASTNSAASSATATSGTDSTDSSANSASGTSLGGQTGQTFGGAGIIGFSPNSPKQSILSYKKKNHYNEWEFVYDPLADQKMIGGNTGTIGQPANGISNGIGGPTPNTPVTPTTSPLQP
jgi:type II secretory pathway pseudopilin PulG